MNNRLEVARTAARHLMRVETQTPKEARAQHFAQMQRLGEAGAYFHAKPQSVTLFDRDSLAASRYHIRELGNGLKARERGVTQRTDLVIGEFLRIPLRKRPISAAPEDLPDASGDIVTIPDFSKRNS